jgi:hypothetical protein
MGRFLEYDRGRRPSTKKYYLEPHHPSVSLMDVQKDLGRMTETKITNTELNWLYSAFIAKKPINPTQLMINQWCCEQHRIREIGLLPLHVGYLFKTGYYKEPEASPT